MLILLSQNEQGISALDLQKHIFPSGSSSMKSTFPWMQRHYVNYYKGEQLYETNRRETALAHPRKKNYPLEKTNYRPVSVLPIFSILYEKVLEIQLSDFFDKMCDPYLCAFRRDHGCQTTMLRLLKDWREALDKHYYTAAVLKHLTVYLMTFYSINYLFMVFLIIQFLL